MNWIKVLLIGLLVAVLGQVARADEIDTFTVRELTVPGFIPLTNVPTTIVTWQIVGEFEDFDIAIPDIIELFRIKEVPGETGIHLGRGPNCLPTEPLSACDASLLIFTPTTLPLGINLSSTVEIPETSEVTPEPGTFALLLLGLFACIGWSRYSGARHFKGLLTQSR